MIAPAPLEPDADLLLARFSVRVLEGDDVAAEASIRRAADRRRREKAIAARKRREARAPVRDAMTTLGEACGLKLVRVGEIPEPPLPAPRKRAPRTPRPPA